MNAGGSDATGAGAIANATLPRLMWVAAPSEAQPRSALAERAIKIE
jgi:hypothetical protein